MTSATNYDELNARHTLNALNDWCPPPPGTPSSSASVLSSFSASAAAAFSDLASFASLEGRIVSLQAPESLELPSTSPVVTPITPSPQYQEPTTLDPNVVFSGPPSELVSSLPPPDAPPVDAADATSASPSQWPTILNHLKTAAIVLLAIATIVALATIGTLVAGAIAITLKASLALLLLSFIVYALPQGSIVHRMLSFILNGILDFVKLCIDRARGSDPAAPVRFRTDHELIQQNNNQ